MMAPMSSAASPLRYLAEADVLAAMPPVTARLDLAEQALRALVTDADMPAKIAIHGRVAGMFGHAMPAFLRGAAADGSADRAGMKWVTGSPLNRALGLPAINALVVLSDAATGLPIAILDGGPITAHRTAAVSGVAIRAFAPGRERPLRIAIVGAGRQALAHLPVLAELLPGGAVVVFDRHPDRAARVVEAAGSIPGIGPATAATDLDEALGESDIVLTMASFTTPDRRQALTPGRIGPAGLVVAVDYDTLVSAEVARAAGLFVVDDRPQFLANRSAGSFAGYPDPGGTIGEALLTGTSRPDRGRVLVSHLGVGLADVVFGSAILAAAAEAGRGMILPR